MTESDEGSRINPPHPWPRDNSDEELKKQLERAFGVGEMADSFFQLITEDWPIEYGTVKIQIRKKRPTLMTIERTVKLD